MIHDEGRDSWWHLQDTVWVVKWRKGLDATRAPVLERRGEIAVIVLVRLVWRFLEGSFASDVSISGTPIMSLCFHYCSVQEVRLRRLTTFIGTWMIQQGASSWTMASPTNAVENCKDSMFPHSGNDWNREEHHLLSSMFQRSMDEINVRCNQRKLIHHWMYNAFEFLARWNCFLSLNRAFLYTVHYGFLTYAVVNVQSSIRTVPYSTVHHTVELHYDQITVYSTSQYLSAVQNSRIRYSTVYTVLYSSVIFL